ncbi:Rpp20 subunit of nuclear RNase MRP and P-domain-containing protein [Sordaria brevicollis]|uniref:Rpp20 subunit of nuclear RNase MRP and P-domain-containing protein n=1 Tax=Sordaria brevicollis TaxID=83679 RepID=A0AAE0UA99_SORBR|nr:Rpp20 subunit of nuclear RNase MRP and P-domain-containing protein [Sordaria brevicollis]
METSTTPKPLPNRPEQKMPPIPKGSRIQKRPLPAPLSHRLSSSSSTKSSSTTLSTTSDLDGYRPPPRAAHTLIIKVSSSAPFMSLVKRVRKGLESRSSLSRQQTTKGLPFTARIAALDTNTTGGSSGQGGEGNGPTEDALDDVVLVATGRAIQKAVEVGCFFTRERDLQVLLRTRTVRGVDDVVKQEEGDDGEDGSGEEEEEEQGTGARVRAVSCVEVGVRWRAT